ncbi:amino acid adenylation domain-containing protein [Rhodococcus qingshengii]|uniref:amino acid adenylation domain-containing protein n=1 Tax=Rhodococcus qingshengii TaxID=334542 RepID=UPI0037C66276
MSTASSASNLHAKRIAALRKRMQANGIEQVSVNAGEGRSRQLPVASAAQHRIWLQHEGDPTGCALNVGAAFRLQGALNHDVFRDAVRKVIGAHEILRTRYRLTDEGELVAMTDLAAPHVFDVVDSPVDNVVAATIGRRFDLGRDHPIRAVLQRNGADDHLFVLVIHHIAFDDASWPVLLGDLSDAFVSGSVDVGRQFLSVAATVDRDIRTHGESERAHLVRTLSLPAVTAPIPTIESVTERSASVDVVELSLSESVSSGVRDLARASGTTAFSVLLTALALALRRCTVSRSMRIATPVLQRDHPASDRVVGYFGNVGLVTVTVDPGRSFRETLDMVSRSVIAAVDNKNVPFETVVELLSSTGSSHPIQTSFAIESAVTGLELPGVDVTSVEARSGVGQIPFSVLACEVEGRWNVRFEYFGRAFDKGIVEDIVSAFERTLTAASVDGAMGPEGLSLLTDGEWETLRRFGTGRRIEAVTSTVSKRLRQQAQATPTAAAVRDGELVVDYRGLVDRISAVSNWLAEQGLAEPETVVACALSRGIDSIVLSAAVFDCGAAYFPVDYKSPQARIEFLLNDAAPTHLFVDEATESHVPDVGVPRTVVGRDKWTTATATSGELVGRHPDRDALAYVIYTSGSTGVPKGVAISHAALADHLEWLIADSFGAETVSWLQLASPSFDVSIGEVFAPLCSGGEVIVAPEGIERDPAALSRLLTETGASTFHAVPSMLPYFLDDTVETDGSPLFGETLTWVPVGGEALPGDVADRFNDVLGKPGPDGSAAVKLDNFYGPTETTQCVTKYPVRSLQGARVVPIGKVKWGNTAFVLDEALTPVPPGRDGELYIQGSSLARGYLHRPALSATRFVASPFDEGSRLYRTGDLVRYNAAGDLEFLGRIDDQTQIRGFRVEPLEVENALRSLPAVRSAAVLAGFDAERGTVLMAYVSGDEGLTAGEVRTELARMLPDYMVPASLVVLDELPLDRSGKLDRRALPGPSWADGAETSESPRSNTENIVARQFSRLLDVPVVGVDSSFFSLGGHSLLLTKLLAGLEREFGCRISVADAFAAPTVRALASAVDACASPSSEDTAAAVGGADSSGPAGEIHRAERPDAVPMSTAQKRIWFLDRFEDAGTYNVPIALEVEGTLDVSALRSAFDRIISRHESLRTIFPADGETGFQKVLDRPTWDIRVLDSNDNDLSRVLSDCAEAQFDLEREIPIAVSVVRVADDRSIISILLHHIIADERSAHLLIEELVSAYDAIVSGRGEAREPLPLQYADYALWQHRSFDPDTPGCRVPALENFWKQTLAAVPAETAVCLDRPRPPRASSDGGVVHFTVEASVRRGVERVAQRVGATPFMVLHAAVAVLLSKLGAGQDIPLGSPISERSFSELDDLIGLFVNIVVLRHDLTDDPTIEDLVRRAKRTALDAYEHADFPFEKVVEAIRPERSASRHPLFQVLVQLRESESSISFGGEMKWTNRPQFTTTAKYDLSIDFEEVPEAGGYVGEIIYRTDLYDASTIERLVRRLSRVLGAFGEHPSTRLSELSIDDPEETATILNRLGVGQPSIKGGPSTLVELLDGARDVLRDEAGRERIAIVCGSETITYSEFHSRAARLSRLLLEQGAGPEKFVALAVPRSIDMAVALVAVLQTGAAYLPLDLRLPKARLDFMIGDAAPVCLLTRSDANLELDVPGGTAVLIVDSPSAQDALAAMDGGRLPADVRERVHGDNLSFFLFTSGSTGMPKGVIGTQRGYCERLSWQPVRFPIADPDVRLCQGWLSFHDGGCEILAGIVAGATLVLADEREARDMGALVRLMDRYPIAQVTAVPTAVGAFLDRSPKSVASVKRWVCSGEPLTSSLFDRLREAAPDSEIANNYGATELCGGIVRGFLTNAPLHLGEPINGARVLVLDERLRPCPIGVVGEVYGSSPQRARGYWGNPALTAARFIADPFGPPGSILYRTGDRAEWDSEGRLQFRGRTDHQVEVRGIRIELGEIEAALRSSPEVELAAARTHENGGHTTLAGYVTLRSGSDGDDVEIAARIRAHLSTLLPSYTIPSAIVVLEAMPLTGSGKLDRPSLPTPELVTTGVDDPPITETERVLAELMSDLLSTTAVGRGDGFFALGGDSIISVQLASRARLRGLPVSAHMIFEHPTLEELAAACDRVARTPSRSDVPKKSKALSASGLDKDALSALMRSWKAK